MELANIQAIEEALATVQRVLDLLGAQGRNEEAFRLARAQFAASVRSSWPGNLSALVAQLEGLLTNAEVQFDATERAKLAAAIATLRGVSHG
jgi:hypothetical protein